MLLFSNNPTAGLIIGIILAALIGMTIHEFAHNYVAHLMGDPTPASQGRLTLNPMAHIYWPGFLMFVVIGFGILGLAPINYSRMRNPRWGYLAAVAAGPFSNLLLAIVIGLVVRVIGLQGLFDLPEILRTSLLMMVTFNIWMFIFNLLPLFPLDGWHIVLTLLPPDLADSWYRNAQTTQYVFLGIILLSFLPLPGLNIIDILLTEPLYQIRQIIIGF